MVALRQGSEGAVEPPPPPTPLSPLEVPEALSRQSTAEAVPASPRRGSGCARLLVTRSLSRIFCESGTAAKVHLVVLTGGPCAGKSTALSTLQQRLEGHGFNVFALPEVASMMFNAGADWSQFATTDAGLAVYQTQLARIQIEHEDRFAELARSSPKPTVIICDRGVFDGKAFCPPAVWATVLTNVGYEERVLLKRYDAVIHMVTAAEGAEAFYNLDNPARRENLEEAREVDMLLRECWAAHPGLSVVGNGHSFPEKIQDVVNVILNLVGVDPQGYIPRRFEVHLPAATAPRSLFPHTVFPTESQALDIFFGPMTLLRQRKSHTMGYLRLEREMVTAQGTEVLIERVHRLRQEEFDAHLLAGRQQEVRVLHKTVLHFEFDKQSWELHLLRETPACVLAVETEDEGPLDMPPFLQPYLGAEIPKSISGEFEDYPMALRLEPDSGDDRHGGFRLEALAEQFEAGARSPTRAGGGSGSPDRKP